MKAVRKRIIIKNRKPLGEYYRAATLLQVNMDAENKISDDPAYIPINLAKKAGMLILENGGETFRAEETVMRICRTAGYTASETIALPTGLFITLSRGSEAERQIGCRCADTVVGRVKKRTVDLSRLEQTNAVARLYTGGEISAEEAYRRLCELERERAVNKYLTA
ncbi:MAG: threonine/serine exporter family protein, partial [Eubacteriales bacterium]